MSDNEYTLRHTDEYTLHHTVWIPPVESVRLEGPYRLLRLVKRSLGQHHLPKRLRLRPRLDGLI